MLHLFIADPKNLRRPKLINSGLPCPDYTPLGSGLGSKGKRCGDCHVQQGRCLRLAGADVLILEQTFFARNADHGQGPGSDVKELVAELWGQSFIIGAGDPPRGADS